MTPAQLADALRVRRRREDRALAALQQARAVQAEAEARREQAVGALVAFDARVETSMRAFEERARSGLNADRVVGMRAYHADRMQERQAFMEPIALAERAVLMAAEAVTQARHRWLKASQAAGNLQEMTAETTNRLLRELERYQEQDSDEMAAARAGRTTMERDA